MWENGMSGRAMGGNNYLDGEWRGVEESRGIKGLRKCDDG